MNYPSFDHMSDLELAIMQSEARKVRDADFINAILIEIGKRQKDSHCKENPEAAH